MTTNLVKTVGEVSEMCLNISDTLHFMHMSKHFLTHTLRYCILLQMK